MSITDPLWGLRDYFRALPDEVDNISARCVFGIKTRNDGSVNIQSIESWSYAVPEEALQLSNANFSELSDMFSFLGAVAATLLGRTLSGASYWLLQLANEGTHLKLFDSEGTSPNTRRGLLSRLRSASIIAVDAKLLDRSINSGRDRNVRGPTALKKRHNSSGDVTYSSLLDFREAGNTIAQILGEAVAETGANLSDLSDEFSKLSQVGTTIRRKYFPADKPLILATEIANGRSLIAHLYDSAARAILDCVIQSDLGDLAVQKLHQLASDFVNAVREHENSVAAETSDFLRNMRHEMFGLSLAYGRVARIVCDASMSNQAIHSQQATQPMLVHKVASEREDTEQLDNRLNTNEFVSFATAAKHVGVTDKWLRKLANRGVLDVVGQGHNKKLRADSVIRYFGPQKGKK